MNLLLATGNRHKIREISQILFDLHFIWRTTAEWPDTTTIVQETGKTYEENARLKALAWCDRSGLWTLADDSGLEVDALDGRPGVRSARYAHTPHAANEKLLAELRDIPEDERTARFVCVACLASPSGEISAKRGTLEGHIAFGPRGEHGFGYDPVFVPKGFNGKHLAEMGAEEKNRISHRARALKGLRPHLERLLEGGTERMVFNTGVDS